MSVYYRPLNPIFLELKGSLFNPIKEHMAKMIDDIVLMNNTVLNDESIDGFQHNMKFYYRSELARGNWYIAHKYRLPELEPECLPLFSKYKKFEDEYENNVLYIEQFLKKLLLHYASDGKSECKDLGEIIPPKLLTGTNLKYQEGIYHEDPVFSEDWKKYMPVFNELLAMRAVL